MKRIERRWLVFSAVAAVTLIADHLTKWWARAELPTDPRGYGVPVSVIDNFWDWRLAFNKGSAFSFLAGQSWSRWVLTIIGVIAIGFIVHIMRKTRDDQLRLVTGLGLVLGGAIGNVVERIITGQVTDFIVWKYYDKEWPTFNIADVALVIGVGILFIDLRKLDHAVDDDLETADAKSKAGKKSAAPGKTKRKRKKR